MRRIALTVVLVASWPGVAQAGWRIDRATEIAAAVWNHPCVDHMQIKWTTAFTGGAGSDPAACTVYLPANTPVFWPELCRHLIHEAGHLAGYRDPLNPLDPWHSHNPESVMYAEDTSVYGIVHGREVGGDPRCRDRGQPYLRQVSGRHVETSRHVEDAAASIDRRSIPADATRSRRVNQHP